MKFYYEATAQCFYDGTEKFLCEGDCELRKKDIVAIEIRGEITTAIIQNSKDELEALLSDETPREIIQKIEVAEYLIKKENKTKKLLLLREMEEKCKEVKLLETLKKYSDRDEDMKMLYNSFEKLGE